MMMYPKKSNVSLVNTNRIEVTFKNIDRYLVNIFNKKLYTVKAEIKRLKKNRKWWNYFDDLGMVVEPDTIVALRDF